MKLCFLRTLHLSLALVKRDIPLDLLHALERLGIVPRCILDFGLVGGDGVVGCVTFVGAVGCGGCGREVRLGYAIRWELVFLLE
jgi:hypothetical protein